MTSNQVAYAKVVEEAYANRNREKLQAESNQLQRESNAIAYMNATTQRYSAETKAREVEYNYILQQARNTEEARHNLAAETQTARYNQQSTILRQAEYELDANKAVMNVEMNKYNQEQETYRSTLHAATGLFGTIGNIVSRGIGLLVT